MTQTNDPRPLAERLRERLIDHRYLSQSGFGMRSLMPHHIDALVADLTPFVEGLLAAEPAPVTREPEYVCFSTCDCPCHASPSAGGVTGAEATEEQKAEWRRQLAAAGRSDSPDRIYPCIECGTMRTKAEGGTTFTVCDDCWDKAHPKAAAAEQPRTVGSRERQADLLYDAILHLDDGRGNRYLSRQAALDLVDRLAAAPEGSPAPESQAIDDGSHLEIGPPIGLGCNDPIPVAHVPFEDTDEFMDLVRWAAEKGSGRAPAPEPRTPSEQDASSHPSGILGMSYDAEIAKLRQKIDDWRHVAEYYLGDEYTDVHTPQECRAEAIRRTLKESRAALRAAPSAPRYVVSNFTEAHGRLNEIDALASEPVADTLIRILGVCRRPYAEDPWGPISEEREIKARAEAKEAFREKVGKMVGALLDEVRPGWNGETGEQADRTALLYGYCVDGIAGNAVDLAESYRAPSAPTREQVEALRLNTHWDSEATDLAFNEAIDRVLALYGESAKQDP